MIVPTLIEASAIQARVRELGAEITRDYAEQEVVLVAVLKGSFIFAADLCRAIDRPVSIDFFGVRSYSGQHSTGVVQTTLDLSRSIEGKHVVVVEDIVDTGLTLQYIFESFAARRPASLKLASLLHKPARTKVDVDIHYLGFSIDDVFVVGYGLDFDEQHRHLPYLGAIPSE